ncbi:carbohydrate porin, partial [Pseudomonas sp. GW704-F2]|uniref:carbohydrate porin n=1 Tax=Pseudomonas sp. GW704-F2 TaxID=2070577 RepID=UPI0011AF9EDF
WFARYSWNNGTSASWAFTEIDRSFQTGAEISGLSKKKNDNVLGIAAVINGLSPDHKNYLQAGGYGFIIGDGKLNYAHEIVFEAYY